jgi:hypothetical protein
MRVYTVHLRCPGPDEDLILIREGFSWMAFLFTWIWALWNRLWLFAAGLFAANAAVAATVWAFGLHPWGQASLTLAVSIGAGYLAFDQRRRALEARGFEPMGVVAAPDLDAATRRFLDEHPVLSEQMA